MSKILCIKKNSIPDFSGLKIASAEFNIREILGNTENVEYVERELAETSEEWLQIIPYIVLVCGENVFSYKRNKNGGEERLHDQMSIGIGGHIEVEDSVEEGGGDFTPFTTYLKGALREITEETGLNLPFEAITATETGMLMDKSSEVGRVHLGVLHMIRITQDQIKTVLENTDETMSEPVFTEIKSLASGFCEGLVSIETWSALALTHLNEIMSADPPWKSAEVALALNALSLGSCMLTQASIVTASCKNKEEWIANHDELEMAIAKAYCGIMLIFDTGVVNAGRILEVVTKMKKAINAEK